MSIIRWLVVGLLALAGFALAGGVNPVRAQEPLPTPGPAGPNDGYYSVEDVTVGGVSLKKYHIKGPPQIPQGYQGPEVVPQGDVQAQGVKTLEDVPAYLWEMGCSATASAMIVGYYDRTGYQQLFTGASISGSAPLTEDSSWGTWTDAASVIYPGNPLIASRNGLEGRSGAGTIDDYWVSFSSSDPDPYISAGRPVHLYRDAISDYIYTSQSARGLVDGETVFFGKGGAAKLSCQEMSGLGMYVDGTYGRNVFYAAHGYTVTDCFYQNVDQMGPGQNYYNPGGFSFADYVAEIDSGNPVLINLAGHSIVGVGYDSSGSKVLFYNTWDASMHEMAWGDSYAGMAMQGVSIVHMQPADQVRPNLFYTYSPTDGATKQPLSLNLGWDAASGAASYKVCLYTTSSSVCDDASGWLTPSSTYSHALSGLKLGTTYHWMVMASNANGINFSNLGSAASFKTITGVPVSSKPSGTVSDPTPSFEWGSVIGAGQYTLELYKGATKVYWATVATSACSAGTCKHVLPASSKLSDGAYKWHVRSKIGTETSAYSPDRFFTLLTVPVQSKPVGAISSKTPTFEWKPVSGATQYKIIAYKGGVVKAGYPKTAAASACTATLCKLSTGTLLLAGSYSWKIQAQVEGEWRPLSGALTFSVK